MAHRTRQQKASAVIRLLRDDPEQSNGQVASVASVSKSYVQKVRTRLEAEKSIPVHVVRIGMDAKSYRTKKGQA